MRLKSILIVLILTGALTGCSSPQKIVLKDNTVIETRDEVNYNKKTGFYEYENTSGKSVRVNSTEIKKIKELD